MRVVFAGTPEFAAKHLSALAECDNLDIVAVYTQPDRPAGRGKKLHASAVKQLAESLNLPVEQPASLKSSDAQQQLASYQADVMIVVAYGLLLPQAVLDTPRLGCINVHGSLLPRWRGAAPIQRAIWAGDNESGVAIMQMAAGLDTGPVLLSKTVTIAPDETSASLYERLAECGPPALIETLNRLPKLQNKLQPQDESLATYASKLTKAEAEMDWQQPAEKLERHIRAFNPWPVSWFRIDENTDTAIKVWQADVLGDESTKNPDTHPKACPGRILSADKHGIVVQTGHGALRLTMLQPPGKRAMSAADLLNSRAEWFTVDLVLPLAPTATSPKASHE